MLSLIINRQTAIKARWLSIIYRSTPNHPHYSILTMNHEFQVPPYLVQHSYSINKDVDTFINKPQRHLGYLFLFCHPNPLSAKMELPHLGLADEVLLLSPYRLLDFVVTRVIEPHTSGFAAVVMNKLHWVKTPHPNNVGLACMYFSTVSQLPDFKSISIPIGFKLALTALNHDECYPHWRTKASVSPLSIFSLKPSLFSFQPASSSIVFAFRHPHL